MIYHRFLEMLNEDCFDNVMIELYGSSAETIARQKKRADKHFTDLYIHCLMEGKYEKI